LLIPNEFPEYPRHLWITLWGTDSEMRQLLLAPALSLRCTLSGHRMGLNEINDLERHRVSPMVLKGHFNQLQAKNNFWG
jgi:hypothetical protein